MNQRNVWKAAVLCVAFAFVLPVVAQPRGGGGRRGFDPETQQKIWKVQADSVSLGLGLDEEKTGQLAEAYSGARTKMLEAFSSIPRGEGDRGNWEERREAYRKIRETGLEDLQTAVSEVLDEVQAASAQTTLAAFDFMGDRFTNHLIEVVKDEKQLLESVQVISGYLVEAASEGDQRSRRESYGETIAMIMADLGEILSEEDLTKLYETVQNRGGGRGRRGGGN